MSKQKKILLFQVCDNCQQHQAIILHRKGLFDQHFQNITTSLSKQFQSKFIFLKNQIIVEGQLKIVKQPFQPSLGAFEIWYNSILVYSKIQSGAFPRPDTIINILHNLLLEQQTDFRLLKYESNKLKLIKKQIPTLNSYSRDILTQFYHIPKSIRFNAEGNKNIMKFHKKTDHQNLDKIYLGKSQKHKKIMNTKAQSQYQFQKRDISTPSKSSKGCALPKLIKKQQSITSSQTNKQQKQWNSQAGKLQSRLLRFDKKIRQVKQISNDFIPKRKNQIFNQIIKQEPYLDQTTRQQLQQIVQGFLQRTQKNIIQKQKFIKSKIKASNTRIPPEISYLKPQYRRNFKIDKHVHRFRNLDISSRQGSQQINRQFFKNPIEQQKIQSVDEQSSKQRNIRKQKPLQKTTQKPSSMKDINSKLQKLGKTEYSWKTNKLSKLSQQQSFPQQQMKYVDDSLNKILRKSSPKQLLKTSKSIPKKRDKPPFSRKSIQDYQKRKQFNQFSGELIKQQQNQQQSFIKQQNTKRSKAKKRYIQRQVQWNYQDKLDQQKLLKKKNKKRKQIKQVQSKDKSQNLQSNSRSFQSNQVSHEKELFQRSQSESFDQQLQKELDFKKTTLQKEGQQKNQIKKNKEQNIQMKKSKKSIQNDLIDSKKASKKSLFKSQRSNNNKSFNQSNKLLSKKQLKQNKSQQIMNTKQNSNNQTVGKHKPGHQNIEIKNKDKDKSTIQTALKNGISNKGKNVSKQKNSQQQLRKSKQSFSCQQKSQSQQQQQSQSYDQQQRNSQQKESKSKQGQHRKRKGQTQKRQTKQGDSKVKYKDDQGQFELQSQKQRQQVQSEGQQIRQLSQINWKENKLHNSTNSKLKIKQKQQNKKSQKSIYPLNNSKSKQFINRNQESSKNHLKQQNNDNPQHNMVQSDIKQRRNQTTKQDKHKQKFNRTQQQINNDQESPLEQSISEHTKNNKKLENTQKNGIDKLKNKHDKLKLNKNKSKNQIKQKNSHQQQNNGLRSTDNKRCQGQQQQDQQQKDQQQQDQQQQYQQQQDQQQQDQQLFNSQADQRIQDKSNKRQLKTKNKVKLQSQSSSDQNIQKIEDSQQQSKNESRKNRLKQKGKQKNKQREGKQQKKEKQVKINKKKYVRGQTEQQKYQKSSPQQQFQKGKLNSKHDQQGRTFKKKYVKDSRYQSNDLINQSQQPINDHLPQPKTQTQINKGNKRKITQQYKMHINSKSIRPSTTLQAVEQQFRSKKQNKHYQFDMGVTDTFINYKKETHSKQSKQYKDSQIQQDPWNRMKLTSKNFFKQAVFSTDKAAIRNNIYGQTLQVNTSLATSFAQDIQYSDISASKIFQSLFNPEGLDQQLPFNSCFNSNLCNVLSLLIKINTNFVTRLFQQKELTQDGVYSLWLCKMGKWVLITVNDLIPVKNKQILTCLQNTQEFWPSLLQKSIINLLSMEVYKSLSVRQILSILTGCYGTQFKIRQNSEKNKKMILYIRQNKVRNHAMIAQTRPDQLGNTQIFRIMGITDTVINNLPQKVFVIQNMKGVSANLKQNDFSDKFSYALGFQLRTSYQMACYSLNIHHSKTTVLKIRFPKECHSNVCFNVGVQQNRYENPEQSLGISIKSILYQESQQKYLRRVGEIVFKKSLNFYQCNFKENNYYLFVNFETIDRFSQVQQIHVNLSFYGQQRLTLFQSQVVSSEGYLNQFSQFVEAKIQKSVQSTQEGIFKMQGKSSKNSQHSYFKKN